MQSFVPTPPEEINASLRGPAQIDSHLLKTCEDVMRRPLQTAFCAALLAMFFIAAPHLAHARPGDIDPEYGQWYQQQHQAAQRQGNQLDNQIARYGIPIMQALDRTGMSQMFQQAGQRATVAMSDFNPIGMLPIGSMGGMIQQLTSGFFSMSSAGDGFSGANQLASQANPAHSISADGKHFLADPIAAMLATPIQAAAGGEKKVQDNPDSANYQSTNQSPSGGSTQYPTEQENDPCSSADPDNPCQ